MILVVDCVEHSGDSKSLFVIYDYNYDHNNQLKKKKNFYSSMAVSVHIKVTSK